MRFTRHGIREMVGATILLGGLIALVIWQFWPLAFVPFLLWVWVLAFFRDPERMALFARGELCAPADGRVTEVSHLEHYDAIGGPAVRIGIFLSVFDVHINRSPCRGRVTSIEYSEGTYLDARHPDSGASNEANRLVIQPTPPVAGPVVVRQVAGKVARRIVCGVQAGEEVLIGQRIGMIKFGSRTELILPDRPETEIKTWVGQAVRAGITVLAVQRSRLKPGGRLGCHSPAESE